MGLFTETNFLFANKPMGLLISPWAYSRIKSKFLKISFANKPMGLFAKFLISNDFNGDLFLIF